MKNKYFTIAICMIMSCIINATEPEIVIGIQLDIKDENLHQQVGQSLYDRVLYGMSQYGIGANYSAPFVATVGMTAIGQSYSSTQPVRKVMTYDVFIHIRRRDSHEIFNSFTTSMNATGRSDHEAALNAVRSLTFNNQPFRDFVTGSKVKIVDYYKSNCNALIAKAEMYNNQQAFVSAIATLMSIPAEGADCFQRAKEVMTNVMKDYQAYVCQTGLVSVKALIGNQEFDEAVRQLIGMPYSEECEDEMHEVTRQLREARDIQDQWAFDFFTASQHFLIESYERERVFMQNMAYILAQPNYQRFFDRRLIFID